MFSNEQKLFNIYYTTTEKQCPICKEVYYCDDDSVVYINSRYMLEKSTQI